MKTYKGQLSQEEVWREYLKKYPMPASPRPVVGGSWWPFSLEGTILTLGFLLWVLLCG